LCDRLLFLRTCLNVQTLLLQAFPSGFAGR
jgi:hypothetical protein